MRWKRSRVILLNKSALRKHYRKLCDELPNDARNAAAMNAAEVLVSLPIFQQSDNIACYAAYPHEFDTMPLITTIWQSGKKCYLPIVMPDSRLTFAAYFPDTKLAKNQYGIFEPRHSPIISLNELDLIIMPLVAFDADCHRLGTGGGYYDRTLAEKHSAFLLGLGFSFQQAAALPSDPWDINPQAVLTEKALIQSA